MKFCLKKILSIKLINNLKGEIKLELIGILGEILAHRTPLSPPACRGLIKLAIKDQLDPFKPFDELDYDDLKKVISNSLKNRLLKLEIKDSDGLVEILLNELNKNQSLLTMSKV
jgi:hypothetical protein